MRGCLANLKKAFEFWSTAGFAPHKTLELPRPQPVRGKRPSRIIPHPNGAFEFFTRTYEAPRPQWAAVDCS